MSSAGDEDQTAEQSSSARDRQLDETAPAPAAPRPFVGRSRGVITATREDLLEPVGESWEIGQDL
jgi:hypothetical protein